MKLFRRQFKPTIKFFLVFLAVSLTVYLLFKDTLQEAFVDANYVLVGIKIEGSLSTLYSSFTNTDTSKNLPRSTPITPYDVLIKYPKEILGSIVDKYPDFKYSIIDTSNDKVIYDPVAEYKNNKTMSPFPNTSEVGKYILYSNYYKVVPLEELRKINDLQQLRIQEENKKANENKKPGVMSIIAPPEINPIRVFYKDTNGVCTTIVNNINMGKAIKFQKAHTDYAKSIKYKDDGTRDDGDPTLKANMETANKELDTNSNVYILPGMGVISIFIYLDIKIISPVYEDCAKNGFQNMEGFADTHTKLYDDTGAVVSSAAIVIERVEKKQEATKSEKIPAANSNPINQCCTIS
jgi:hypothetical protein